MITLFEQDVRTQNRQSSKGNQLKWENNQFWYKADYIGYEGLVEYVVANLLKLSTLKEDEFVLYETDLISYKKQIYNGCKSKKFLPEGWQLITLERLFKNNYGKSLYETIYKYEDIEDRILFLVNEVIRMTGLKDFGIYFNKMITIDALFLNEDRHTHNIAVLLDSAGMYHLSPFFDHGASLMSDIQIEYPLSEDTYNLINTVKSKTICDNFDLQLDSSEKLYGQNVKFKFKEKDIRKLIDSESNYSDQIKLRVLDLLLYQKHKYNYLFE